MDYLDASLTFDKKNSMQKSTFLKIDTFMGILTNGMHHTLLAKSLKLTTICLKMEPGSENLEKSIR
jgi:hypothetical protein